MKILYVDAVGPFGGASRSLFEAVGALPSGSVVPFFVMQRGTAQAYYGRFASGIVTARGLTRFDNTRFSHYRGIRWLILLRELFHLPFTLLAILKARWRWRRVDLIHVNEVVDLVPGLIAKAVFGAPLVVHVRSLQWTNTSALRTRWVHARLRRSAAAVIAIDENTRATLPGDLPVEVIHNAFTPKRAPLPDEALVERLSRLRPSSLKVGFVGNLHQAKGLFDLLEAARLLHEQGCDVEFLIVGGVTISDRGLRAWLLARAGLAQNLRTDLDERVRDYRLESSFHLLGPTDDIQCVYERLDLLAFPSHLDAPGRPVFEAAFSAVASIVCVDNPRPDTLVHGQTGLAIPAHDPKALAAAIRHFADDRAEVRRMGANARALAQANFVPARNARALLDVYQRVLSEHPRGSAVVR